MTTKHAEQIAGYLARKDLKPGHLAAECGLQASTLSRLLSGERINATRDTALALYRGTRGELTLFGYAFDKSELRRRAAAV